MYYYAFRQVQLVSATCISNINVVLRQHCIQEKQSQGHFRRLTIVKKDFDFFGNNLYLEKCVLQQATPGHFFITVDSNLILSTTGFEPLTSGVEGDSSTI